MGGFQVARKACSRGVLILRDVLLDGLWTKARAVSVAGVRPEFVGGVRGSDGLVAAQAPWV